MKKGFTLIEILLVVLVIGILTAIAVPQYQKAVAKSKFATLKNNVKAIYQAEKVYYLANGKYTTSFNELDINTASNCSVQFGGSSAGYYAGCSTTIAGGYVSYLMWFDNFRIPHSCYAASGSNRDHIVHWLCKDETGRTSPSNCNGDSGGCNYHPY